MAKPIVMSVAGQHYPRDVAQLALLSAVIFIDRTLVPSWFLLVLALAAAVTFLFALWEHRTLTRHPNADDPVDWTRGMLKLVV